jgi:hypothetical protein
MGMVFGWFWGVSDGRWIGFVVWMDEMGFELGLLL